MHCGTLHFRFITVIYSLTWMKDMRITFDKGMRTKKQVLSTELKDRETTLRTDMGFSSHNLWNQSNNVV